MFYVFCYFCQSWLVCLESKEKIMGLRIFFYRISKFIWGMSLVDRPVICKKVQEILSIWMQDSRFKAEALWIQEVFLGSWILNLESDVLREGWDGNTLTKSCKLWSPKNALSFRVQNVKKNTVNTTKFAWKLSLGGYYIYTVYIYMNNRHIMSYHRTWQ